MVLSPPIPWHSIKLLYLDFPQPNFDFLHQNWREAKSGETALFVRDCWGALRIKDFCHIWLRPVFVAILESCITLHAPFTGQKRMRTETWAAVRLGKKSWAHMVHTETSVSFELNHGVTPSLLGPSTIYNWAHNVLGSIDCYISSRFSRS